MEEDNNDVGVSKRSVLNNVGEEENNRLTTPNRERRGFLRGTFGLLGGSLASALGLSNRATAASPSNADVAIEAAREFRSEKKVRSAVEAYATGPLRKLEREVGIDRSSLDSLPITRTHRTPKAFADADQGTLVGAIASDGEPTVQVQIKRRLPEGRKLLLIVEPSSGKSRAVLQTVHADGTTSTVETAARTASGDVTIQDDCLYCDNEYHCRQTCTSYGKCYCDKIKVHTCSGGGTHCDYCETVGDCCGDYNCSL